MSYQALYRKYRPKNFDEVVGQKHIIKTLSNAIKNNRIAHAYLFCGPRGTGKTSTAKIFAKMLNCSSENHKPCEECENCKMFNTGSHPDIIEIDAASNNGVDEVRNLIDKVKYAPMEGRYKIYIIDEVHMMTSGAFNALLKTIEEPPAHVLFIFATTEPNKVLPTIISRCQRFDFGRVSEEEIIKRLSYVCEKENIKTDEMTLQMIAELSDGGMRDSLSILDQCVAYCIDEIHIDDVRQIYGIFSNYDLGELYLNISENKMEEALRQLQDANTKGMDLKRLTSDFITLLKESIILGYSRNTTLVSENHKQIINKYFLDNQVELRIQLLEELMNTYNKYVYASNVLDYLESAILKVSLQKHPTRYMNAELEIPNQKEGLKNPISDSKSEKKAVEYDSSELEDSEEEDVYETSDVSRETITGTKKDISSIILHDEFVIQLLVGANKALRIEDSKQFSLLKMYMNDLEYAKYANSLIEASLIASAETYILVTVPSDLDMKLINEIQMNEGYESFTKKLLGKEKKVFAIDQIKQKKVIKEFKDRMVLGTLPAPAIIEIRKNTASDMVNDENNPLSLFDNLIIVDD
ncbi:MAG: DNA polymerase III subunit gamma/tau [Bacillota bacterium]|nr:DNA polymerase III subunit gamma/tau [Bacillota bacterium]